MTDTVIDVKCPSCNSVFKLNVDKVFEERANNRIAAERAEELKQTAAKIDAIRAENSKLLSDKDIEVQKAINRVNDEKKEWEKQQSERLENLRVKIEKEAEKKARSDSADELRERDKNIESLLKDVADAKKEANSHGINEAKLQKTLAELQGKYKADVERERIKANDAAKKEYDGKVNKGVRDKLADLNAEHLAAINELKQALADKDSALKSKDSLMEAKLAEQMQIANHSKNMELEQRDIRIAELVKQSDEARKQVVEAQRKLEERSQERQGEVVELGLEYVLTNTFLLDKIEAIPHGVKGADVIQTVFNRRGENCGSIAWEVKNCKNWKDEWIAKAKSDSADVKANLTIIATTKMPEKMSYFGYVDGVLVCETLIAPYIAGYARDMLIRVAQEHNISVNKADKSAAVYEYMTSKDAGDRIAGIFDSLVPQLKTALQMKNYVVRNTSKIERGIKIALESLNGFVGDLKGLNIDRETPMMVIPDLSKETDENDEE